MQVIARYLSLVKFSHTLFALPFAMAGYVLGITQPGHRFEPAVFIPVLLCMVFARTAAMAFNRWLDRDIDAVNPRTKNREIPAGKVRTSHGLILAIVSAVLFIATTYFINRLCLYLSPIALFVIFFYSYTKRFTWLCHWVLGAGLALAPIGAYIAVTGEFAVIPILLSVTVLFWVSGFDILYAIQDEHFDKSQQLQSIPSFMGRKNSMVISAICHLMAVGALVPVWHMTGRDYFFLAGIAAFSLLLFLEHREIHIRGDKAIAPAFFNYNSWAGVLLCSGFIAGLLMT